MDTATTTRTRINALVWGEALAEAELGGSRCFVPGLLFLAQGKGGEGPADTQPTRVRGTLGERGGIGITKEK